MFLSFTCHFLDESIDKSSLGVNELDKLRISKSSSRSREADDELDSDDVISEEDDYDDKYTLTAAKRDHRL